MEKPRVRISGDRNLPVMKALMDVYMSSRKSLNGLIEVILMDGYPLNIIDLDPECSPEKRQECAPLRKVVDGISQLLQDNGFEEASKYIDCHYEL